MVRRVLLVVIALMLLTAACGSSSGSSDTESTTETTAIVTADIPTGLRLTAQFTCSQLSGVAASASGSVISGAVTRAAAAGFSGPELRDAMRSVCFDTTAGLEGDAEINSLFDS